MASFNVLMQSERNWPAAAHPKNKTEIRCSSTLLLFYLPCSNDKLLSYISAHESKPNAIYWNLLQHEAQWFQILFILFIVQIRCVLDFFHSIRPTSSRQPPPFLSWAWRAWVSQVYATHFPLEFSAQASICGIPSTRDVGTHSGWWCIAKWVVVLDLALYSEWIAATLDDAPWSSHKVLKLVKENTQIRFWGCHGHCF